jgi:hypothetical protein
VRLEDGQSVVQLEDGITHIIRAGQKQTRATKEISWSELPKIVESI